MTRTVHCRKYQRELEGLDAPPMPGPKGQEIFDTVSKRAWAEWQALQTMLINEKHLDMRDPAARRYLSAQRERFLDNEDVDRAEGYIPPATP
jgi:Fe-S cluster biosynthesis and repair protein YggX